MLSAGVEWLQAEMGPRQVWRHQETTNTIQTHLASWYSALQQVSTFIASVYVCGGLILMDYSMVLMELQYIISKY